MEILLKDIIRRPTAAGLTTYRRDQPTVMALPEAAVCAVITSLLREWLGKLSCQMALM
ncbi:hypothetical protein [Hymenobacter pini]|uniref:hypothetical protein n=1 Tax=Hymenobacter pini TaxID=2880879 RepID=UPI001CF36887|nr:hypothetical protein [Hymenobacter pini]MCA8833132.1 hypothetical protein [Hymenobacter pini]